MLIPSKAMETDMTERPNVTLPEPIAAYFAADRLDAEAVARCFTNDAVVKDEGETHAGLAAIRRWKTEAAAKYTYTSEPFLIEREPGLTVEHSHLDGSPALQALLEQAFTGRGSAPEPRYKDAVAALTFVPLSDIPKRTASSWGDLSQVQQPHDPTR